MGHLSTLTLPARAMCIESLLLKASMRHTPGTKLVPMTRQEIYVRENSGCKSRRLFITPQQNCQQRYPEIQPGALSVATSLCLHLTLT